MSHYILDITEQNLTEVLQQSQQMPLALVFYAPSHADSLSFTQVLERYVDKYQGQFVLGKINCETEQMVAAQFRIQALPTTYLFKEGQALDAFQGALDEATLEQHLSLILPKEEEIKFNQALDFLSVQNYDAALPLLKEAWEASEHKNSDIALLYAETYIAMKKVEPAQEILNRIPLQDRDSRWQGLQAQIELLIKAADTPEIQQLQQDFAKNPSPEIALKLALQLHQAHRNEEALDLLFSLLKQDLTVLNGEVKQEFLSILAAIGNNDPITNKYRRLLYSLLY
ncbi:co-chaperone YbbN [Avibacterium paragallinarum]|uniref:Thioredoxin domain-containing protein n=1 Tax=Avibacterium paragallinarum TaxID=728 RepID=A0A0F5ES53_AVIPA|nr:co-chaperone YbbN [Avibacterium paragallinarum]AZI14299.1 co-chaperone YbbN [Avibacterium paragallinarum]POY47228.1 co-chaperone YbbN [Avibacterium paragallinarum]QIR11773.1 co-chaperone YbbN [Avibacterium paragallinarum]QJE09254.1 co-chaperone YbbN [Avibacterium paragallinarum]QJE11450.1 co-chaperone YbbN [Avibacterium paragallinarum]